jgi:hypothetical protein
VAGKYVFNFLITLINLRMYNWSIHIAYCVKVEVWCLRGLTDPDLKI